MASRKLFTSFWKRACFSNAGIDSGGLFQIRADVGKKGSPGPPILVTTLHDHDDQ